MLAEGFGPGFNGPIIVTVAGDAVQDPAALDDVHRRRSRDTEGVAAVTDPIPVSDDLALVQVYADSAPQDKETTELVHHLRDDVVPDDWPRRARRRLQRGVGRLRRVPRRTAAVAHRRGADPQLHPADGRVPIAARAAQGRHHEPAVDRRGVRRRRRRVPVGLGCRPHRRRSRGPDRGVGADDDVRDRVRPLDGLRDLPPVPHEGGVRPDARQRDRGRRRPRRDRPGDHRGRADHGVACSRRSCSATTVR